MYVVYGYDDHKWQTIDSFYTLEEAVFCSVYYLKETKIKPIEIWEDDVTMIWDFRWKRDLIQSLENLLENK